MAALVLGAAVGFYSFVLGLVVLFDQFKAEGTLLRELVGWLGALASFVFALALLGGALLFARWVNAAADYMGRTLRWKPFWFLFFLLFVIGNVLLSLTLLFFALGSL